MPALRLSGGEALLRSLEPEQIPFVAGIVGGKLAPFLQALSTRPHIRFIGTRHEGHAAMMASAVGAISGQLGLAVGECGGGGANMLPGAAIARSNSLPMFIITSNNQHWQSYPSRGMFAEMDNQALFAPATKWNAVVHDGRRIPELVRSALRQAFSGRPGPVHLDVPQDVLRGSFEYEDSEFSRTPSQYRLLQPPAPGQSELVAAVRILRSARRPLLIAGGGLTLAGAAEQFRQLALRLQAPALATQMGNGAIAGGAADFLGMAWVCGGDAVHRALGEADAVLAVGCRFSSWLRNDRGTLLNPDAKLIHIDSDATVIGQHAPITVGICADARATLATLDNALGDEANSGRDVSWFESLRTTRREWQARLATLAAAPGSPMHPAAAAAQVAAALPADALAVFDGGHSTFWSNDFMPAPAPRTRFNEPGMSQLGFGLPWALTAKLLHPSRPVFNVTGDGAFGFSLQELDTARRHGLPVITVVYNNAQWGVIRLAYGRAGFDFGSGNDFGTMLSGTDYAAIARGFGCHGEVVESAQQVGPAIRRALDSGLPAVIDCRTQFVPHPAMPHFGRMSSAGAG